MKKDLFNNNNENKLPEENGYKQIDESIQENTQIEPDNAPQGNEENDDMSNTDANEQSKADAPYHEQSGDNKHMIAKKKKTPIFNKRALRYGSYSFVLTVIVIAAAVILNAIVGATQIREILKIDLTSNKLYSIGEVTDNVLKELDKEVELIGLFDESQMGKSQYSQVIEFVKQYDTKSDKIKVRYIDPEKEPGYIQNELDPEGILGVKKYDFVVRSDKRTKVLSTYDIFERTFDQSSFQYYVTGLNAEYAFTGAIRYVASDNIPVIYYAQGHGEADIENDYTELKSSIELNGYEVKPLTLSTVEEIPDDAAIILFASPLQDLSTSDREKLTVYMENGGNTVFLFDPIQSNLRLTNFEEFLAEYNVGLSYDIIYEMAANRSAPLQPMIFMPYVENNSINKNLDPDRFNMTVVNVRSIKILKNVKEWITTTPLLTTSQEAVGRALIEGDEDNQGPLHLAVAVEHKGNMNPSKILVVGNSYFVSDEGMDSTGSGKKFLLNSLNWMLDKEDSDIYIPVKKYTTPRLEGITKQTLTILFIGLIIVVPLIIIGLGVFVWLRRRHL